VRYALIALVSFMWYPHSLERVHALGYDFTIFFQGPTHPGWLYASWVSIAFEPLRIFPHDTAFAIHYTVSALAFCLLVAAVSRRSKPLGWIVCMLGMYPFLLSQEFGSLTPILAALCLTFPGALLAGCVKPYLFGIALIHAIYQFHRTRTAQTLVDGTRLQGQPVIFNSGHCPYCGLDFTPEEICSTRVYRKGCSC
jgi:hypothetical protein